jgi:hypothetical protein
MPQIEALGLLSCLNRPFWRGGHLRARTANLAIDYWNR